MRFSPRDIWKMAFFRWFFLEKGHSPCIAWEKSHVAGGRKSGLTSAPLALRKGFLEAIVPESSPESSAQSLPLKFFVALTWCLRFFYAVKGTVYRDWCECSCYIPVQSDPFFARRHSDRGGGKMGATGSFWGGGVGDVARHLRDISKTSGICCDTVCATLCSAKGVAPLSLRGESARSHVSWK